MNQLPVVLKVQPFWNYFIPINSEVKWLHIILTCKHLRFPTFSNWRWPWDTLYKHFLDTVGLKVTRGWFKEVRQKTTSFSNVKYTENIIHFWRNLVLKIYWNADVVETKIRNISRISRKRCILWKYQTMKKNCYAV